MDCTIEDGLVQTGDVLAGNTTSKALAALDAQCGGS